jgi:hypothetical protein
MSATGPRPPLPEPGSIRCPRCSSPIGPEQDWCLECGAPARTRLAPTPNWRLPTVAIAAIVALAGALLAFSFVKLTGGDQAPVGAPSSPAVADPSGTTGTTTPTPGSTTATAPATTATTTSTATTNSNPSSNAKAKPAAKTKTTSGSAGSTKAKTTSSSTATHATSTKKTTARTTRDIIPAKVPTPP